MAKQEFMVSLEKEVTMTVFEDLEEFINEGEDFGELMK
jgi:hypothetical protein